MVFRNIFRQCAGWILLPINKVIKQKKHFTHFMHNKWSLIFKESHTTEYNSNTCAMCLKIVTHILPSTCALIVK